jgi:ligand-binding sensor domain-containing protein/signal transduction histidine kinase
VDRLDRATGTFTHCLPDSANISVQVFLEDRSGNVWAGTSSGLYKFDVGTLTPTLYLPDPLHKGTERSGGTEWSNYVLAVREDRDGLLWIGTGDGLYSMDRSNQTFTALRHDKKDPGSIGHNSVNDIYEDNAGSLWFGTGGGLDKLDRKTNRFTHFWHYSDNRYGDRKTSLHWVTEIFEDHAGILWLGTVGGLVAYDRTTGTCTPFRHDPIDHGSMSDGGISAVCEDPQGVVWIGTRSGGGLNAYDRRTGKFSHYVHDESDPGSLGAGDVNAIYYERSGTLWISTDFGRGGVVNKLNRTKSLFTRYVGGSGKPGSLSSSDIRSIIEDRRGTLWITNGKGLESFNPGLEVFTPHAPNVPLGSLAEDPMGNLWIGAQAGTLYKRDPRGHVTAVRDSTGKDFRPDVIGIRADHEGNLWIGSEQGLFEIEPAKDAIRAVDLAGPRLGIHREKSGLLWVGTREHGLLCYDLLRDSTQRFTSDPRNGATLSSNTVMDIYQDRTGTLWFGTALGVNRYDRPTQSFTHFTQRDGLPHDVVMRILEDDHGQLWLGTLKGLSKFNPRTKQFKNYDVSYGLLHNDMAGACLARNGEMYFGGPKGLVRFHPDSIRDNPYVPPIIITSFRHLDAPFPLGHDLHLDYKDNSVSFEFVALSFISPERNQYAFRMEGLDTAWVYSGTRRFASYAHLEPGHYVFRVKGSNNDGIWNEAGTSIVIVVTPPFWVTWWFRGFAFVAIVVSVGGGIRYVEIRKLQRRIERLEQETALERERTRISADMHDEVGSSLSEIAILSELAKTKPEESQAHIQEISDLASEVIDNVSEIVWAMNPRNDTLDNLVAHLRRYAVKYLNLSQIRCSFDAPDNVPPHHLTAELRRNMFLVMKEALHNIVKHAHAGEVSVTITLVHASLEILIEDNGKGFNVNESAESGNGLGNMSRRMADIGGTLTMTSRPEHGTRVVLGVPTIHRQH